jgi:glycosyltransferase involved in cell wall biosynthesis
MTVFIIDRIGCHSGTHYYNRSFRSVLCRAFEKVTILTNFDNAGESEKKLFLNYYEGSALRKSFNLFISILRYWFFIYKNRNNFFIFLSYGNIHELIFILPLIFTRKFIVDVHEIFNLIDSKDKPGSLQYGLTGLIYRRFVRAVIVHSDRSVSYLDLLGYEGIRMFVSHFSINITTNYDPELIPRDVLSLVREDRTNVLFFGFMRYSKGILSVINTVRTFSNSEFSEKINFIIAGNDPDHIFNSPEMADMVSFINCSSVLLRFITDGELRFLFTKADFIFLPYEEIYQSGVLDMAFHFKKPVVASSLPYLRRLLGDFPSFGVICDNNKSNDYFSIFKELIQNKGRNEFYSEQDRKKYAEYKNCDKFLAELREFLLVK